MKTVLIIGADFPPSSLPPATRIRFFVKHLSDFGWEPIVLTSLPEYYESQFDPENERLLPESLRIIRTRALSAAWTRKLGFGDIGMRTLWHHWQSIKELCRDRTIDLIFIPVPPYVPMLLGRLARRKFAIPYVVDYIDPWVTDYYNRLPRKQRPPKWFLANAISRLLEPLSLRKVAHLTGVSKGTTDSVIGRYDWLSEGDATEIPYGADAGDFEYLRLKPRQNPIFDSSDGLVHLSYVGACIPGMYPSVRALFQAVRIGLERAPDTFGPLRMHFVGTSYAAGKESPLGVISLAREAGIEDRVDEYPTRVPYLDSLQVMLDSRALFMVGSEEPHYTASKIFPYILARRPILAIFHEDSSVVRILRETNSGEVITFGAEYQPSDRVVEISKRLEQILAASPDSKTEAHIEAINAYTTRAMTQRLVEAFDRVLAAHDQPNTRSSQSEVQSPGLDF